MPDGVAIFPSAESGLGLHTWLREIAAAIFVTLCPAKKPAANLPRGQGESVFLIPGFGSGDWALIRLAAFLSSLNYHPKMPGIFLNLGPTQSLMANLNNELARLAQDRKVALIGVSLGGVLARDLARQHPEMVSRVITLCSPVRFPVTTPLQPLVRFLSPLHAPKWTERRHEIASPLPVPVTAIHAANDGVVLREDCWIAESENARNVVIDSRHMTIASNPEALTVIAQTLAAKAIC